MSDFAQRLGFWLSLVPVIPQALRVRRTAPRFAGASGPASGSVGSGPPLRLAAIGDSIVAGVGADTFENALVGRFAAGLAATGRRSVPWSAHGLIGARADTVLSELVPTLPATPADVVLLSVGVNDVTGLRRTDRWRRELTSLLDALERHSPSALIVVAGLPPLWGFPLLPQPLRRVLGMRAKTFDRVAAEVAGERTRCAHVPTDFDPSPDKFAGDGYHPSRESYGVWGRELAERVTPLLPG